VLEIRQYLSGLEDQITRHELTHENNMYVVERQFTRNGLELAQMYTERIDMAKRGLVDIPMGVSKRRGRRRIRQQCENPDSKEDE